MSEKAELSDNPQQLTSPDRLSKAVREEIDEWVKKFPEGKQQSALLAALRLVQAENGGWLTTELMDAIAAYLQLPRIAVYEVASFYTLYDLKEVGKYKLYLCTNVSCMLRGCDQIAEKIKQRLDIDFGQTTSDGKFTLKEVECLGACGGAPVMQVNTTYHENLTPEGVETLLERLEKA